MGPPSGDGARADSAPNDVNEVEWRGRSATATVVFQDIRIGCVVVVVGFAGDVLSLQA
jgi:hypothetical protein